jgi:hypothetical protein
MLCATIPVTMATIIAVSTEAMILFHSKDDIGALSAPPFRRGYQRRAPRRARQQNGFRPPAQINYHASDIRTNRACCRSPIAPMKP